MLARPRSEEEVTVRVVARSPRMRFNNLQVLRLFLALGVVLFHLGTYSRLRFGVSDGPVPWLLMPWVASAFVPTFFALSGFVLTLALQRTPPGRYLLLRALRLYPGFWLAVALVMIVHGLGLWPAQSLHLAEPRPTLRTFGLLATGRGHSGQYPLMIEWTLIYEVFLSVALLALWMVAPKRLPWLVGAWLLVLAVKSVFWPGYGARMLPKWNQIWASVFLVPFLLGVLAFHCRDRGKSRRWAVLAVVVGLTLVAGVWVRMDQLEIHYWLRGLAAAMTVWLLVQIPDVSPRNRLAVAGDYSYGLYLVHVPLILLAMGAMRSLGVGYGTWHGVLVAGLTAIGIGLGFGRLEAWIYGRAKRLAAPRANAGPDRAAATCIPSPVAVADDA
jgi:peptidoglycan/LPS O-acetylase OafA/YrhL